MSNNITYAYAGDIVKTQDEDGSLMVYGKATGPDLDLDEQVCDESWLKTAVPEWFKFGNVREMHQPIAAGIGVELNAEGDDWFLKSQVVHDNTARKIEAGALKGYSIGIKGAKVVHDDVAKGGRIVGGTIVEVSYVDRPCNPTAIANIAKSVNGTWKAVESSVDSTEFITKIDDISKDAITESGDAVEAEWDAGAGQTKDPAMYPEDYQCSVCDGLGKYPETGAECQNCGGTGRVDAEPAEAGIAPNEIVDSEDKDATPEVKKADEIRESLPTQILALIPEVEKVEHNTADLMAVRSSLIALIKAELDEIDSGLEDEVCDVRDLLVSLKTFLDWWTGEASEGETPAPFVEWEEDSDDKENEMAYVAMGVSPDTIKAAKTGDEESVTALRDEIRKALGFEDFAESVTEIAKAAQREEVDFLKAELERIKEMAAPGGPAITRTHAQSSKALDAERLTAEAERLRQVAREVTDAELKVKYLNKADSLAKSAAEILGA